jgi:hypothetical protein
LGVDHQLSVDRNLVGRVSGRRKRSGSNLHVKQKNVVTLSLEPQVRRQSANFQGSK